MTLVVLARLWLGLVYFAMVWFCFINWSPPWGFWFWLSLVWYGLVLLIGPHHGVMALVVLALVWFGLVCYDLVWYGLVWYVWFGYVSLIGPHHGVMGLAVPVAVLN